MLDRSHWQEKRSRERQEAPKGASFMKLLKWNLFK
jgi:hypothetical protein